MMNKSFNLNLTSSIKNKKIDENNKNDCQDFDNNIIENKGKNTVEEIEEKKDSIKNENSEQNENLEEDEYAVEEEEYLEVKDDNNDIENKNIKMDKDIKFVRLINNKIIKKLFELYDSKEKMINFNNTLLDDAANYWNNLENFLKENKLI